MLLLSLNNVLIVGDIKRILLNSYNNKNTVDVIKQDNFAAYSWSPLIWRIKNNMRKKIKILPLNDPSTLYLTIQTSSVILKVMRCFKMHYLAFIISSVMFFNAFLMLLCECQLQLQNYVFQMYYLVSIPNHC